MQVVEEQRPPLRTGLAAPSWERSDTLLVAGLWAVAIFLSALTWAQWGNVTIDIGREMYVPAELNRGRTLYRDVIYQYGPLIPYWNALLYRMFGTQLNVLYSTGIAVVLAIVTLLFQIGRQFMPRVYAFVACAAFLLEAFERRLVFSYPMPYSFPAIYSSLAMVLLAYLGIRAIQSKSRTTVFWAAVTSAAALLTKQEFGVFSLLFLIAILLARYWQHHSGRALVQEALLCVPPLLVAGAVYLWFCSLGGLRLLLEENFMSAPQHYFTKHYGAVWAEVTGMKITPWRIALMLRNGLKTVVFWGIWIFAMRWILKQVAPHSSKLREILFWTVAGGSAIAMAVIATEPLKPGYAFPLSMYAFVSVLFLLVLRRLWLNRADTALLARAYLIFVALVVAFRVCTAVQFYGYSIYYNPLLYLCGVMLLAAVIDAVMAGRAGFEQRAMRWATVTVVSAGLLGAAIPNYWQPIAKSDMLVTPRGKIAVYTPEKARAYQKLLAFFEWAKANGRSAMVLPEDTSLYFLADVPAPSRFYEETPGVIAPCAMTAEYLRDLAKANRDYIVVTNRPTAEYGVPYFGIDYDQPVLQWIEAHYEVVGEIGKFGHHRFENPWGALVYRRRGLAPLDAPSPIGGRL